MGTVRIPFETNAFATCIDPRTPLPVSRDDLQQCFDPRQPYPLHSRSGRATAGAPPPPGRYCAPTSRSCGRVKMSPFDEGNGSNVPAVADKHGSPAIFPQPLAPPRRLRKSDEATRAAPSNKHDNQGAPSATYSRRSRKRAVKEKVLQRGEPSGLEQDAQTTADLLADRVEAAARRVAKRYDVILKLRNELNTSNAKDHHVISQAMPFQEAKTAAESALELARAEASAAKARLQSPSRPRIVLNYLKARWAAEPRPLDVDEAERCVDEAVRVLSSAKEEEDRAWEVVYQHFNDAEAVACKLHNAQGAHAIAECVLFDLKDALVRAEALVVSAVRAVNGGRWCWAEGACAGGRGEKVDSLLVAAGVLVASVDDGFTSDQVAPNKKAKRARY